jgi:hypothetical protein
MMSRRSRILLAHDTRKCLRMPRFTHAWPQWRTRATSRTERTKLFPGTFCSWSYSRFAAGCHRQLSTNLESRQREREREREE